MRQSVLRVGFLQLFAGDHNGNGRFGDEIVGKRAQEDADHKWLSVRI